MYSRPDQPLVTLLRRIYSKPRRYRPSNLRPLHSFSHQKSLRRNTSGPGQLQRACLDHGRTQIYNERVYSTSAKDEIAILGGGITGLASAFYLTKELPSANITIYEASDRLGGWLQTKYMDVEDGTILFEQGPRTLRPKGTAGILTLDMVRQLGLEDEILATSKDSVAARNRFVYYPDRLVTMPGPGQEIYNILWSLLTEPVFGGLSFFTGLGGEFRREKRSEDILDESVGSFLRRRLGTSVIGDNIASAVLHGIYAGDIEKLSAQSLLTKLWDLEGQHGSLTRAWWENIDNEGELELGRDASLRLALETKEAHMLKSMIGKGDSHTTRKAFKRGSVNNASVYSFKRGIGSLSKALEDYLRNSPGVEIRTGHPIDRVLYKKENDSIRIKDKNESKLYSRVISTISSNKLSSIAQSSEESNSHSVLPTLALTPSVTVMVVNLYFKNPDILPEHGFGYLIPRSIPFEQNPECALGVVFDSDATFGQDSVSGTKVTVMMGGHWWDGLEDLYPSEDEGASMAKAVLKRHLKIEEEPAKVFVSLQRDCIPQYTVGHQQRMIRTDAELMQGFNGKLAVAGSSYTGVGVNDCVKAAWEVVDQLTRKGVHVTGLEHFTIPRTYVQYDPEPVMQLLKKDNGW